MKCFAVKNLSEGIEESIFEIMASSEETKQLFKIFSIVLPLDQLQNKRKIIKSLASNISPTRAREVTQKEVSRILFSIKNEEISLREESLNCL